MKTVPEFLQRLDRDCDPALTQTRRQRQFLSSPL
jgi:hypothetical protein